MNKKSKNYCHTNGYTAIMRNELLREIKEIKKAFDYADLIKSGKLKGRPVEELLLELTK